MVNNPVLIQIWHYSQLETVGAQSLCQLKGETLP